MHRALAHHAAYQQAAAAANRSAAARSTAARAKEPARQWVYQFSEPTSQGLSLHGDEINYVFGTLSSPSKGHQAVSADMMAFWANFAKSGDPNEGDAASNGVEDAAAAGHGGGGPARLNWPAWDEYSGSVINFTATPVIEEIPPGAFVGCPFFDEHWDFYSGCLPP